MAEPFNGRVIPFEQLYEAASEADIVISSTGAPHPIFRREHGQAFMHRRRNRPMFFIDIAVPRDVDPAVNKLEGIFVYDIDDLQQVAAAHMAERSRQAGDAETLIAAEVERFHQRRRAVNVAPAIVACSSRPRRFVRRVAPHARPSGHAERRAACRRRSAHARTGQQVPPSAHAGPQAGGSRKRLNPRRGALRYLVAASAVNGPSSRSHGWPNDARRRSKRRPVNETSSGRPQ